MPIDSNPLFSKNRSNFAPAITCLQIALRADNEDYRTWIRLGEAYSRSGRPAAALKALLKAHELQPDDWTCLFFTADVYRQMGLYDTAIVMLEDILVSKPEEIGALIALAESYLALGHSQFATDFLSRAETSWANAIRVGSDALQSSSGYKRVAWKAIADALLELSSISVFTTVDDISPAFNSLLPLLSGMSTKDKIGGIFTSAEIVIQLESDLCGKTVGQAAVAAYYTRIALCEGDDELKAAALFDYAVSLFHISKRSAFASESQLLQSQASTSLKLALRSDPGNEVYWNALGVINFTTNQKIAQHSFIKALELDPKVIPFCPGFVSFEPHLTPTSIQSPVYWTHLGLLYLHNDDPELANHALYKAQVLNPDYTLAWVGQSFVAVANGHLDHAKAVLEHALTLPVQIVSLLWLRDRECVETPSHSLN